jgi:cytochrome c-type biogenesis protein CcmF
VRWLKGRYQQLQPYIIATLMVVVGFFSILMIFAANPFATSIAGSRVDGDGLNPLLQSYWMIIHPPSLYTGFVGCTIPFAFAVAALVSGRLDNEWILAVRKWMLFAFLFLSIGNVLGMMWAYEELGWGGFWAWDPVENAACLPWFGAAAYLHSTMIQERRNMLRVWNIFLICLTFFLTIYGTFLTRAGLITSVHAFAQSNIGIFFVWFMGFIVAGSAGLLVWRWPRLRAKARIESLASREAMFVVNNWALLGALTFIAVATLFPKISEWLWNETVTVGPPFFNRWMAPMGLLIFALMGLAPLFGWRKSSAVSLQRACAAPLIAMGLVGVLHIAFGSLLGFPPWVKNDAFYPGLTGLVLQKIGSAAPLVTIMLAAFNLAVIAQEFVRGAAARRAAAERRGESEGFAASLFQLVQKNRRRYGGYIVHLGIISMFIGFVGTAWSINREVSMSPGQSHRIDRYVLTYRGSRMCPGNPACSPEQQADINKRMVFADLDVTSGGQGLGRVSPAKFIYNRQPDSPTTEVAMLHSLRADLYTVVGMVDPSSKRATFQFHVNTLVCWIWVGLLILISGVSVSFWPDAVPGELRVWSFVRAAVAATAASGFALVIAMSPAAAMASKTQRAVPGLVSDISAERGSAGALAGIAFGGLALGAGFAGGRSRARGTPGHPDARDE